MAMIYEKADGGAYREDGQIATVEDPNDLIRDLKHQPVSACFGASAPTGYRVLFMQAPIDDAWKARRAPYLPENFDSRFFNMAHPDLVYPGYLQGGGSVRITHMHN